MNKAVKLVPWLLCALLCPGLSQGQSVIRLNYNGGPFNTPGGNTALGVYNQFTVFTVSNTTTGTSARWALSLQPIANNNGPVYLNSPGTTGTQVSYNTVLAAAFPTWNFNYNADGNNNVLANNSLVVRSYSVFNDAANPAPTIGVNFEVEYNAAAGAGNPPNANTHWIQVINTNWKANTAPPTNDNKVDNGGAAVAYYDTTGGGLGDASNTYFFDGPTRFTGNGRLWDGTGGFTGTVNWTAEDYLVQQTNAANVNGGQDVTVWDGVRYGFTATLVTPEPGTWAFAVVGIGVGFFSLRRRNRYRRRAA